MKLLIEMAIVFFATLLAAALVAFGAPILADLLSRNEVQPAGQGPSQMLVSTTQPVSAQEAVASRPSR